LFNKISGPAEIFFSGLVVNTSGKVGDVGLLSTGLPVVLKFYSCPEIVLKSAIVLKFYSFGQNVLIWTFVMLSLHFFTSHDYVYVADVECQVMFFL